jgi:hypothetical protein
MSGSRKIMTRVPMARHGSCTWNWGCAGSAALIPSSCSNSFLDADTGLKWMGKYEGRIWTRALNFRGKAKNRIEI